MSSRFMAWFNSPTGPRTTHFWGPVANWGFVVAGIADLTKTPDIISENMQVAMCIYSGLFMRFAWKVIPRNYLLLACHVSNETVQATQLSRKIMDMQGHTWYDEKYFKWIRERANKPAA
ncbi:hypothetical protein GUITHDRAFT_86074 [Guillardia theta CCMP2712]|uniref:Mitochondrial pyruvate carrier n=2 Tax=Guillardia theta TaxID=55529 RepID=L1JJM6_GUITC|nr:hypothetical protein GUITHDRAFT_86074 [Guillardia theta CCMP2712]EKX48270.1 hypothetical protein GUITHDRAFT_86074 [Guillardia theta CCMP2712]|mmetsp:Transcript_28002/g.90845  ORF Transcript_28002/g.90845 Transcript_28002/m.90845 type:complete len:119 (+) Transcript_28002:382-738(+)|eukprot:XP_005835250.1 hypothetical protein GUITHDRAFT_86074 [Guillardia theta CCMP2712]